MMSSWVDPLAAPMSVLVPMFAIDAIWVGALLYIMLSELKEVFLVIRMGDGPHWYNSLKDDYIAFWNCVDWMAIVVAIALLGLFGGLLSASITMQASLGRLLQ